MFGFNFEQILKGNKQHKSGVWFQSLGNPKINHGFTNYLFYIINPNKRLDNFLAVFQFNVGNLYVLNWLNCKFIGIVKIILIFK